MRRRRSVADASADHSGTGHTRTTPLSWLSSKRARAAEAERSRASEALVNGALGIILARLMPDAHRDVLVGSPRRAAADASVAEFQARAWRDALELVVPLLHEKTEEAKLVFDLRLPDFLSACLLAVAMRGEYQRASSRRAHERMRLTLAEEIFT